MPRLVPREKPSVRRDLVIEAPFHVRTPVVPPVAHASPLWALAYQAELALLEGPPVIAYAIDPATASIAATVRGDLLPGVSAPLHVSIPVPLADGGAELVAAARNDLHRVILHPDGRLRRSERLGDLVATWEGGVEIHAAGESRVIVAGDVVSCIDLDGAERWRVRGMGLLDVSARFAVLASRFALDVRDLKTGALLHPIALPDDCSLQVWRRAECVVIGEDPFGEESSEDANLDRESTAQRVRVVDLETGSERFVARGSTPCSFPDAPVLFVRARDRAFRREERCYDAAGRAITGRAFDRPDGKDSRIVGIDDESVLVLDGDTLTCEVLADPREVRWQLALGPGEDASGLGRTFFPFGEAIAMVEEFGRRVSFFATR